jgi:hypothetical protein
MRLNVTKVLAITIALFAGSSAFAEEYGEYDLVNAEVATASFMGGDDYESYDDGKGCFDDCCSCGPSVYAAVELPWLQINESAFTSDLLDALINNNVPGANFTDFGVPPTYGQEPSWRIYGGVENGNGFGIRGAYWQFDDTAEGIVDLSGLPGGGLGIGPGLVVDSLGLVSSHEFNVGDIEISQRADFCGWNLMMTTGIRIARIKQVHATRATGFLANNQNVSGAVDIGSGREFTGAGLTASFGWEREIRCSGFGLYGNLRGSVLFGDTDYDVFVGPSGAFAGPIRNVDVNTAKVKDQPVVVTEIQLGAQYRRGTDYGVVFVRAGVEGQVWELAPVASGLMDENIGLFGPTFTVGLER